MTRRIRVLHVIQNLNYGGMERLLAEMARCMDGGRFEIHVLVLQYRGRFAEELDGYATVHQAPPLPRYSMLWPARLARTIRAITPDVVHTHSGVWYKASLAARQAGVPHTVHTDHGRPYPDPWIGRLLDRLAARRTDAVVAVSEALATSLLRDVVRDASRIRVIPNGVDTELHRPRNGRGPVLPELGIAPGVPIIGSIGRLERVKGYDIMVRAFAELRAGWSDGNAPVLVVAGDGAERPHLAQLVREHRLGDAVHLLGWRDDVTDLHAAFSLFTMASRSEGTSISLLEAMSAGLCPVVTNVGGNAAVLGPGLAHRLVPGEDPRLLAAAWREALRDPGRLKKDAEGARARVEEFFSVRRTVGEYERIYTVGAGPVSRNLPEGGRAR